MSTSHARLNSPLGEILIVVEDGKVTGLYQVNQTNYPSETVIGAEDPSLRFHPVATELHRYFVGIKGNIESLIAPRGTDFQKKVWEAIRNIKYGTTVTYKELAEAIGSPKSTRAVANAVAKNPITVIIPCHRVVSQNGEVKYSGGERNKKKLLALEMGV